MILSTVRHFKGFKIEMFKQQHALVMNEAQSRPIRQSKCKNVLLPESISNNVITFCLTPHCCRTTVAL